MKALGIHPRHQWKQLETGAANFRLSSGPSEAWALALLSSLPGSAASDRGLGQCLGILGADLKHLDTAMAFNNACLHNMGNPASQKFFHDTVNGKVTSDRPHHDHFSGSCNQRCRASAIFKRGQTARIKFRHLRRGMRSCPGRAKPELTATSQSTRWIFHVDWTRFFDFHVIWVHDNLQFDRLRSTLTGMTEQE